MSKKIEDYLLRKEPKRRKDGRLQHLVNLGQDFISGEKVTKMVYGYTLAELNHEITSLLEKYNGINYSNMTLRDFLKYYIKSRKAALSANDGLGTVEEYEAQFNRYVIPIIGRIQLVDLTPPLVNEVFIQLKPKRLNCSCERTKQGVYVILKTALNMAVKQKLILSNPLDAIDKPTYTPNRRGVLNMDEFHAILDLASKDDKQIARLFEFALFSGCRRGELVALRFSNVDIKNASVDIVEAAKRTKSKGVVIGHPKSNYGIRSLLMPPQAIEVLKTQELYTKKKCFSLGVPFSKDCSVWNDDKANQLDLDAPTVWFAKYRDALNLSKTLTFHSIRHTLATFMAEQDINPKKIQLRLGHASAAFTMQVYTANTKKMQESVIEKIDKII